MRALVPVLESVQRSPGEGSQQKVLGAEYLCLPQIHTLKLNPKVTVCGGGAFGRWLGHEGAALMTESVPLQESSQRALWPFTPVRRGKEDYLWAGKPSPNPGSDRARILDLSVDRTTRNKFLLFISHSAYGILVQQPKWTKTRRKEGKLKKKKKKKKTEREKIRERFCDGLIQGSNMK